LTLAGMGGSINLVGESREDASLSELCQSCV